VPLTSRIYRTFPSQDVHDFQAARMAKGYLPHLLSGSTLIAAMGDHWKPGAFEACLAMYNHMSDAGWPVEFYEEPDRCFRPFDAIGTMRNLAYMQSLREGWEYICYLDNDVLPEPSTLIDLLAGHAYPVVAPVVEFPAGWTHDGLPVTTMVRNQGLAHVGSCVLSMVVIRTSCFMPWFSGGFWENALGADEQYHWDKMATATGVRPCINTDVVLRVADLPHFPLDHKEDGNGVASLSQSGSGLWKVEAAQ